MVSKQGLSKILQNSSIWFRTLEDDQMVYSLLQRLVFQEAKGIYLGTKFSFSNKYSAMILRNNAAKL